MNRLVDPADAIKAIEKLKACIVSKSAESVLVPRADLETLIGYVDPYGAVRPHPLPPPSPDAANQLDANRRGLRTYRGEFGDALSRDQTGGWNGED